MNPRILIKPIIQRVISPFLSSKKSQVRFLILHEMSDAYIEKLRYVLLFHKTLPSTEIIFTFDDGFYSSYKAIKNLPSTHKAIFFVCPAFIHHAKDQKWRAFVTRNLERNDCDNSESLRPATWDNLQELVRLGHRIGSHTMNHARLTRLVSPKELEREIIGSGDMLEDMLQVRVDSIAYPFGDSGSIDERIYRIIKKRYTYCFTGIRGNNFGNKNTYIMWRDHIDLSWPLDYITFVLKGGLDWHYTIKRRRLRAMAV